MGESLYPLVLPFSSLGRCLTCDGHQGSAFQIHSGLWRRGRGCHTLAPCGWKEDQRPGEASVCQVDPLSGNPGRSVARIYSVPEQVGWKGVCEPDNIGALTVDVTHKATVGKREGGGACIFFFFVRWLLEHS